MSGCDFAIRPLEPVRAPVSFERMLIIPGMTEIPESCLLIRAAIVENAQPAKLPPSRVIIDPGILAGPLRVRNILPGDRITPFGMACTKKLQDVFVDKKIHRRERARAVVVTDGEKILWVVGVLASESTRIAGPIRSAIALSAEALQTPGGSSVPRNRSASPE
jgi:tRNA(Ile)-lysidine synthase